MAYKDPLDKRAKESRKRHYLKNKEKYYLNNQKKKSKMRAHVNKLKDVPCTDCGEKFPPYVMDFDHKDRKLKEDTISNLIRRQSWNKLLKEIPKCEVVCSNCHRIRSAKQMNYKK